MKYYNRNTKAISAPRLVTRTILGLFLFHCNFLTGTIAVTFLLFTLFVYWTDYFFWVNYSKLNTYLGEWFAKPAQYWTTSRKITLISFRIFYRSCLFPIWNCIKPQVRRTKRRGHVKILVQCTLSWRMGTFCFDII